MNIFYLDSNPQLAAQYHHDIHLRKMILETAQLLSTAHHVFNSFHKDKVYKQTHTNHPSAVWVRSNLSAYKWTWKLLNELCLEYEYRFDKRHKTDIELVDILSHEPIELCKIKTFPTQPPLCMPDEFKIENDAIKSYRNYYKNKKMTDKNGKNIGIWSKREIPFWINNVA